MSEPPVQTQANPDVEEVIFSHPSANIRGIVIASVEYRKKNIRIGHCTLFTDRAPQITITAPKSLDRNELGKVTRTLEALAVAIDRLDSTRTA